MAGEVRRRRRAPALPHALTTLIVAVAAVIAAPGAASAAPPAAGSTPRGFHTYNLGNGETAQNVCSTAIAAGHVACNALHRTDAAARTDHPGRGDAHPAGTLGDGGAYSPAYLQSAYNIASATAARGGGAGQIVAIVDAFSDPNIASDLAFYRNYFGLPACPAGTVSASHTSCVFEQVNESGSSSPSQLPAASASWGVEESIDVDMVSAICPKCQILLVEASSTSVSDVGTGVDTAVSLGANVVSNSYGGSEYGGEDFDAQSYYDHPGIPIVAASGDNGFGVEFPAAAGDVVAVGGTSLLQSSNTGTRNATESVWSGAGAGCAAYESKPTWQTDTGCSNRTVADVSAVANPATGVWMYDTYGSGNTGLAIYGGTSVAAPIIGSIYALADNSASPSYAPSWLYANSSALVPVTSGTNGTCGMYLCDASKSVNGYNGPSGLGTPGGSPNSLAAFTTPGGSSATVPSAPALVSATPGNGSVALSWSAPSSNGGSPVTGYNVYKGASSGLESATPLNATPITATTDTVTGLTNGTSYYFIVKAINAVGPSVASNELSTTPVSPAPPSSPTLVSATPGNGTVSLTWSAPTSNGTSPLLGYDVFDGTGSGGESSSAVNGSTPITGTTTQISGLTNGTTVYFTVTAVNAVGQSGASNELSATPFRPAAPSSPTLGSAVAGDQSVSLSWAAPASNGTSPLLGYNVFEGTAAGAEGATPVNGSPIAGTTFSATGLTNNTTYYFTVEAVNAVGSSAASNELSAAPFHPTPPSSPSLATPAAGDATVTLTWSAPSSNGTSPLQGYQVYVGTSPGAESTTPANGTLVTGTTYVVTGLTNTTTYYFTVAAVSSVGTSSQSNEVSATPFHPTVPSSPTLTGVTAGDTTASLTWSAPSSSGTSPLQGYNVYVGTSPGAEATTPANGSLVTGTAFAVTGLTDGITYYFTVAAVSAVGDSTWSNELVATPVHPTPPSSPTLSAATAGNGSVALTWTVPASGGTSPLEGYDVYEGVTAGGEATTPVNAYPLVGTSRTITGLTNGISYYFTVAAVSAAGVSTHSNERATTPFAPVAPSAPTLVAATRANGAVTLTWSAPSSVGTSPLMGYNVYVGAVAGAESATPANSSLLTATTFTVAGLTNGKTYYFKVRAITAVGKSIASNERAATPVAPVKPSAPRYLTGAPGNGRVVLHWSGPSSLGTSPLIGYNVFISTSGGAPPLTPENKAPLTATSTTLTGLVNGTKYVVSVTAVTAAGASSPATTTATPATTPGVVSKFTASVTGTSVTLHWTAPASTGGSPITYYEVYRSTAAGAEVPFAKVACTATSCSFTNAGLSTTTTYFYEVAAVNKVGTGRRSTAVSIKG